MQYIGFFLAAGLSMATVDGAKAASISGFPQGLTYGYSGLAPTPAQYVNPYEARRREDAMELNRAARRAIQGNLQTLGFDPGPADGLFGTRTREAIAAWQRDVRKPVSGYLTRQQVRDLSEAANRVRPGGGQPSGSLASDLSFWMQSGASSGQVEGLRRYLHRYPNGHFSNQARTQLQAHENRVSEDERELWQLARRLDTRRAYQLYLEEYPRGHYAANSRARLQDLDRPAPGASVQPDHLVAWSEAYQEDTIAGYERYLRNYPKSRHAPDARKRLQELRSNPVSVNEMRGWRSAQSSDSIAGYRAYIERFPEGHFVRDAKVRLKELQRAQPRKEVQPADLVAWSEARQTDTIAGYKRFLRDYPNSRHAEDARKRLRKLNGDTVSYNEMKAWRRAQNEDSIPGYTTYLERYPNGHFARDARGRLSELRKTTKKDLRPADQVAWEAAHKAGLMEGYKNFIRDYPNSKYVPLARNNIKRLSK